MSRRILHVAGARPNFMKVASVMHALAGRDDVDQLLVHTGQHYDRAMSDVFFRDLGLPEPDVNLGVGSASHARQTGEIMVAIEPVIRDYRPDIVVVVGDVNSTVAAALVASKLGARVAHVEGGLRSFDWSMPEEINRVVTDRLSHFLFTTEPSANQNLKGEGVDPARIFFVGNTMIDTLDRHVERAREVDIRADWSVEPGSYVLVTLHRPSNVDAPESLDPIVNALDRIGDSVPVLFPIHPRTRSRLDEFGMTDRLPNVSLLEPLGYIEFLALMAEARVVLTDSGGIQEETTALGVPCLTLRPNTERPVTITQGTNRLVALDAEAIVGQTLSAERPAAANGRPELWDGRAGERIAHVLATGERPEF